MGPELFEGAWPGEEFDRDLKGLASLDTDDLSKLIDFVKSWRIIGRLSDNDRRQLQKLFPERGRKGQLNSWLSVTVYVLREWARLDLSLAQITEDFQTLGIEAEPVKKLSSYFQSLEHTKQKAHLDYLKIRDGNRGLPVFQSVSATWNIRALFEEDQDGHYVGDVVEHVPIAIVTMETKYFEEAEAASSKTIIQFTRDSLESFLSALNEFAELGAKLERKS